VLSRWQLTERKLDTELETGHRPLTARFALGRNGWDDGVAACLLARWYSSRGHRQGERNGEEEDGGGELHVCLA